MAKDLSIRREFSAETLNAVVNHPEVRPWVGEPSGGYLDLSAVVADLRNVLLMAEGGGFLFQRLADGLYEVHSQFLPNHRGANVVTAVKDALWWMFTRTDCIEVVTRVPDGNVAAAALVRVVNGDLQFHRPNVWPTVNGLVRVDYYSKTLAGWVKDTDALAETGDWFHMKLAAAKQDQGATKPVHDDDDAHDKYVGAAVEMIRAGQVAKGLGFYNRWAIVAGYAPIQAIAENPLVLDIQDAILAVRGDDFEVLLCR